MGNSIDVPQKTKNRVIVCVCVCVCVKRDEKDNKGALGNFEGWWIYVHCLHCGSIQMSTIIHDPPKSQGSK